MTLTTTRAHATGRAAGREAGARQSKKDSKPPHLFVVHCQVCGKRFVATPTVFKIPAHICEPEEDEK